MHRPPMLYVREQRLQCECLLDRQVFLEEFNDLILTVEQLRETLHVRAELLLKTDIVQGCL